MTHQKPEIQPNTVRAMFGRVASRYSLLNRLMTLGQDHRWRREAISRLDLNGRSRLLDLGSGTGELAREALRQNPATRVVAVDLTPEMIDLGRVHDLSHPIDWVLADADELPFAGGIFDRVVSGFLLRNVPDVDSALLEHVRVLRSGGHMVCLETTQPPQGLLRPVLLLYYRFWIPLLGKLLAGEAKAYRYLTSSSEYFLTAESLADRMGTVGFKAVGFIRRSWGTVAIHWGRV